VTDFCPERIIRAASGGSEGGSSIPLIVSPVTANLKRVICNVQEPVLLRLLACVAEKHKNPAGVCLYPEHRNRDAHQAACNTTENKLAQIYTKPAERNTRSRSYFITFIEGQYLSKTDAVLETLHNSVKFLGVQNETPYFYIFYYGQRPVLLTANTSRKLIDNKLKDTFGGYLPDEDACIIAPVGRTAQVLFINPAKRFSFKIS
jgi:hypothetical protein